jgi:hypothetical protein
LMMLAANPDATPEVQALALAGIYDVQNVVKKSTAKSPALVRINQEITLFLRNPNQNTPKIKPSGAPPGPPV